MKQYPRLVIAGTSSGVGKTTATLAILAAFRERKSGLTLGYRTVECSYRSILGDVGVTARGHEFHYSTLVARGPLQYACVLRDAEGLSKGPDGLMNGSVLALYTHLHFFSQPEIAASLVESARRTASRIFEPARSMLGADR